MKTKSHKTPPAKKQVATPPRGSGLKKWLVVLLVVAVVAGASFAAFAFVLPDRVPPELVGKWRVVDGPMDGMTLEFQRNGAMIGRANVEGTERLLEGTADVRDGTLRTTTINSFTNRAETGTQTIVTLTETEFDAALAT